jgi:hypothetical protein
LHVCRFTIEFPAVGFSIYLLCLGDLEIFGTKTGVFSLYS